MKGEDCRDCVHIAGTHFDSEVVDRFIVSYDEMTGLADKDGKP